MKIPTNPSTYNRVGCGVGVRYGARLLIGLDESVQSLDPGIRTRLKSDVYVSDDGSVTTHVVRSSLSDPASVTILSEGRVHPAVFFVPNRLHQLTGDSAKSVVAPLEETFSEFLFWQSIRRSWKCEEGTRFECSISSKQVTLAYQGYYSQRGVLDACVEHSPGEVGALYSIYSLLNHSRTHLFFLD